jgi:glycine/D-amino acid oxidase-like deaminating enzyme
MRRRPWTPDGTAFLAAIVVSCGGWFIAQVALSRSAHAADARVEAVKASFVVKKERNDKQKAICTQQDYFAIPDADGRIVCLPRHCEAR